LEGQVADIVANDPISPVDFFRIKTQEATSGQTRENLQYAVNALCAFAGESEASFDSFTESMLGEWVSLLLFHGYSPKTISNNVLKRIATLYNKAVDEGFARRTEVFKNFQNVLNSEKTDDLNNINDSKLFGKLQDILRTDYHADSQIQLAKDVLFFSIFMGGMSFEEIANYKKDDYKGDSKGAIEIISRYSKPKNKFLFPLKRHNSTPKKIQSTLGHLFADILNRHGIKLSGMSSDISFVLWSFAAMSCGVPASDVAACIAPRNQRVSVTAFVKPSELNEERIAEIRRLVESTLSHNPVRWYAMHLRRNMEFKDLTDKLDEKNITLEEIFYPMEEIFHKVGRKKFFENRPVIPWLVFFRTRVTLLSRLFNEIGEIAWGYRYLRNVRSPYAVISDKEILDYQQAIGTLSPGTRILHDDEVKFNEGDYLVILGGPMSGRHGVLIAEKKGKGDASGRVIFRIRLAGGNNANWEVNWDSRLVKKITEDQYRELDRQLRERVNEAHEA